MITDYFLKCMRISSIYIMAMQAGLSQLNFEPIDKTTNTEGYNKYIQAIHYGVMGNYEPIKEVFVEILRAS